MNWFFFLLTGVPVFGLVLALCFAQRGGIERVTDDHGFKHRQVKGEIWPCDWAKSAIIGVLCAAMGGLVSVSTFWAVVTFILATALMVYMVVWGVEMAATPLEVLGYALALFSLQCLDNAAATSMARSFGRDVCSVLMTATGICLTIMITIVVVSALRYHADEADEAEDEGRWIFYNVLTGITIVVCVVVTIVLLF